MQKKVAYAVCIAASFALLWLSIRHKIVFAGTESSWLEVLASLTGVWSVWLAVKVHVSTWPTMIVSAVLTGIVLWEQKLFANAYLQILYIVLGVLGWYWWLFGGTNRTELPVAWASNLERGLSALAGLVGTVPLWWILVKSQDSSPIIDAFTTAFSIVAQYLQTRKLVENWAVWIMVDIIYIPLFIQQKLYFLTAITVIYLVLAVPGHFDWRKSARPALSQ